MNQGLLFVWGLIITGICTFAVIMLVRAVHLEKEVEEHSQRVRRRAAGSEDRSASAGEEA